MEKSNCLIWTYFRSSCCKQSLKWPLHSTTHPGTCFLISNVSIKLFVISFPTPFFPTVFIYSNVTLVSQLIFSDNFAQNYFISWANFLSHDSFCKLAQFISSTNFAQNDFIYLANCLSHHNFRKLSQFISPANFAQNDFISSANFPCHQNFCKIV